MANDGEEKSSWKPKEVERGAVGKLRKQPARKPPATPYARPPQNQAQRNRWISRLVDPAYRFISGGATRILPYFLSKAAALPSPDTQEQDPENLQDESKKRTDEGDHTWSLNPLESRSTEVGGPSSSGDRVKGRVDVSVQAKGKAVLNNDDGLSELERLLEGRKFSRDETDRLIEIIKSRAVDSSDVEREKKNLETPLEEGKRSIVSLENGIKSIEGKKENNHIDLWATSTPLPVSTRPDDVGLSPVELARAYMGGETSNLVSRLSEPFVPSPSGKPSAYWPGARLSEQYGFGTPQSQRERLGLHNFPRTPYSRTIHSRSKSKLTQLQDDSSKRPNISPSPFQQLQTSYGQFKLKSKPKDTDQGSVGPIRRIRHKSATETPVRGSAYSHSLDSLSHVENRNVSEGFFPAIKNNAERGIGSSSVSRTANDKHKSCESGTPTVHPHSSQMARMILEHLERNQPTPRDKSAELKIATSWRKSLSSDVFGQNTSLPSSRIDFSNINKANTNTLDQLDEDKGNSAPRVTSDATDEAVKATKKPASVSNGIFGGSFMAKSINTVPLFEFGKTQDCQTKSKNEDGTKAVPNSSASEVPANLPNPPSHSLGSKPILSSITVTKPMQRWTFPSDTASGFTFPVSSSSGTSSEPPTPSIIPSTTTLPTSIAQKPEEKDEVPSYSFGTKKSSSPPLVFSFPGVSTDDDLADIKFTFGSENSRRVSFGLVGKDAVCY